MASRTRRQHALQAPSRSLSGITSFAKVTKSSSLRQSKILSDTKASVQVASGKSERPNEEEQEIAFSASEHVDSDAHLTSRKRSRKADGDLVTPESTPQKKVRFTDKLSEPAVVMTPPATPTKHRPGAIDELPEQLQDLIHMNSSLLKAVSILTAHCGTAASIDVRLITPSWSRIWRKRRTCLDDVRLCLGMMGSEARLSLTSYTHGKICLERSVGRGKVGAEEETLSKTFESALKKEWRDHLSQPADADDDQMDIEAFTKTLPRAAITECSSIKKAAPMLAKGQQRLEDLKSISNAARRELSAPAQAVTDVDYRQNTKGRGASLLERLRAKEKLAATTTAPTKADLERQAASQRAPEIVAILGMPQNSNNRCTYSLGEIIETVQNSAKSSWSKSDITRTLDLLADEVTPEFVKIIKRGGITAVVIDISWRPLDDELTTRIQEAMRPKPVASSM